MKVSEWFMIRAIRNQLENDKLDRIQGTISEIGADLTTFLEGTTSREEFSVSAPGVGELKGEHSKMSATMKAFEVTDSFLMVTDDGPYLTVLESEAHLRPQRDAQDDNPVWILGNVESEKHRRIKAKGVFFPQMQRGVYLSSYFGFALLLIPVVQVLIGLLVRISSSIYSPYDMMRYLTEMIGLGVVFSSPITLALMILLIRRRKPRVQILSLDAWDFIFKVFNDDLFQIMDGESKVEEPRDQQEDVRRRRRRQAGRKEGRVGRKVKEEEEEAYTPEPKESETEKDLGTSRGNLVLGLGGMIIIFSIIGIAVGPITALVHAFTFLLISQVVTSQRFIDILPPSKRISFGLVFAVGTYIALSGLLDFLMGGGLWLLLIPNPYIRMLVIIVSFALILGPFSLLDEE